MKSSNRQVSKRAISPVRAQTSGLITISISVHELWPGGCILDPLVPSRAVPMRPGVLQLMGHVLVNPTIVGGQGLSIEATNKLRMTQK